MPKVCLDAAYAPSPYPTTAPDGEPITVGLVYAGGDTPNPVPSSGPFPPYRYRLPCWVRSNPAGVDPNADAAAFAEWLQHAGCPSGVTVVLDLETAADATWVAAFIAFIQNMGWFVEDYGSRTTLTQNPAGKGGYFDAHPGNAAGTIDPGNEATQDLYEGAYDLSWIEDTVPLWDTQAVAVATPVVPAPAPAPAPRPAVPAFPLPAGDWYGPPSANPHNISGYYEPQYRAGLSEWQLRMKQRGWSISATGVFDGPTSNTLRAFQKQKGLKVDGLLGPVSWDAAWTLPVTSG